MFLMFIYFFILYPYIYLSIYLSIYIYLLIQVSGTYTANVKFDFIDYEVKKAFEWLSASERNEGNSFSIFILVYPSVS